MSIYIELLSLQSLESPLLESCLSYMKIHIGGFVMQGHKIFFYTCPASLMMSDRTGVGIFARTGTTENSPAGPISSNIRHEHSIMWRNASSLYSYVTPVMIRKMMFAMERLRGYHGSKLSPFWFSTSRRNRSTSVAMISSNLLKTKL